MINRSMSVLNVVPAPKRVSEATIAKCRAEVESPFKRFIRAAIVPSLRLRYGLAELGEGFQWGHPFQLAPGSRVGRYVYVGAGFESAGPVTIGDLTMVSTGCKIFGPDHLYDVVEVPTRLAFSSNRKSTVFGADVWVGLRVSIREGVTIGDGAVIGSGSIVTRDIEPYTIVVGNPARPIRSRFEEDDLRRHVASIF